MGFFMMNWWTRYCCGITLFVVRFHQKYTYIWNRGFCLQGTFVLYRCCVPVYRDCTFAWRHQPFPSHRGGNWRCQASPHSYWPSLRCTNIDDDVTHSSAGPVYIQDSTFAITLAADVIAPHSARSLVATRMTISPHTFHSYFNWQSMIMFNFNWPEKVTPKAVHIFRNLAALIIAVPVEPRQKHVSVNSNENDQLQS